MKLLTTFLALLGAGLGTVLLLLVVAPLAILLCGAATVYYWLRGPEHFAPWVKP